MIADQSNTVPKPNYGGEFHPDFMIETSTNHHWIIEIEKPGLELFRQDDQPKSEFTQAEKQIRDYMSWVRRNFQFLKDRDWPRLAIENIHGLLIIGKKNELTRHQKDELESINHDRRSSYQIKTFDEILFENITRLENWEKM
jgi:hypothetical protein